MNAATLYSDLMNAAATAPDQYDLADMRQAGARVPEIMRRGAKAAAEFWESESEYTNAQTGHARDQAEAAAIGELWDILAPVATRRTFHHVGGKITLLNSRERLQGFAAAMLRGAAWNIWGGGAKPAEALKPKKARSQWRTHTVKVAAEHLQDGNPGEFLRLVCDELGGVAYMGNEGKAYVMYAPETCEQLPDGFAVFRRCDGEYITAHIDSGRSVGFSDKTRNGALSRGVRAIENAGPESLARALAKTEAQTPETQAIALETWRASHGLIDTDTAIDQAADQVATAAADHFDQVAPDAVADAIADQVAPDAVADAIADQVAPDAVADAIADQVAPDAVADAIADQVAPDAAADAIADQVAPVPAWFVGMAADTLERITNIYGHCATRRHWIETGRRGDVAALPWIRAQLLRIQCREKGNAKTEAIKALRELSTNQAEKIAALVDSVQDTSGQRLAWAGQIRAEVASLQAEARQQTGGEQVITCAQIQSLQTCAAMLAPTVAAAEFGARLAKRKAQQIADKVAPDAVADAIADQVAPDAAADAIADQVAPDAVAMVCASVAIGAAQATSATASANQARELATAGACDAAAHAGAPGGVHTPPDRAAGRAPVDTPPHAGPGDYSPALKTPATPGDYSPALKTPAERSAAEFLHDIPQSLAHHAFGGVSFSPEKRGDRTREGYAADMAQDWRTFHAHAVKGGTLDKLPDEFARYRARVAASLRAYLASSSRCVSSFIAGPANFPAARMNKRADIAHKRLDEHMSGREFARRAIVRNLRPDLRPIMAGDVDAADRLAVVLAYDERKQQAMKDANAAIRKHAKAGQAHQVAALMELGFNESEAARLVAPPPHLAMYGQGFPSFKLTNNAANIRRIRARLEHIEKCKAADITEATGADGVRLEDDPPANRVRLFFPGKPSEAVRAELKQNGFRWAPSLGAWQAYRRHWSMTLARKMAGVTADDVVKVETVDAYEAYNAAINPEASPQTIGAESKTENDQTPDQVAPDAVADAIADQVAPDAVADAIADQVAPDAAADAIADQVAPDAAADAIADQVAPDAVADAIADQVAPDAVADQVAAVAPLLDAESAKNMDRTMHAAQAMTAEQIEAIAQDFEAQNHHGGALVWRCVKAGAGDLAKRAAALIMAQDAAGYLTDQINTWRQAIAAELKARTGSDQVAPDAAADAIADQVAGGAPGGVHTPPDRATNRAPVDTPPHAGPGDYSPALKTPATPGDYSPALKTPATPGDYSPALKTPAAAHLIEFDIGTRLPSRQDWPANDIAGLLDALNRWDLDPAWLVRHDDVTMPMRHHAPLSHPAWHCTVSHQWNASNQRTTHYTPTEPMYPEHPRAMRYNGNFSDYSFGFQVTTDDPELIERLNAAIAANIARPSTQAAIAQYRQWKTQGRA